MTDTFVKNMVTKIREDHNIDPPPETENSDKKDRKSQATQLLEILEKQEMHLFKSDRGDPYASIPIDDHYEHYPCKSRSVSYWLGMIFMEHNKAVISAQALTSVIHELSAKAMFKGQEYTLSNRVAWQKSENTMRLWYDLSDTEWRSICITDKDWEFVSNPPILFRKYGHQLSQVEPKRGGDIQKLFNFVNVQDEKQKILLLVWIITCFIPDFPHPILLVHGSQGSAKSFLSKLCRKIIDPSRLETMSFPNDKNELVQQLDHHWCTLYDNLAWLHQWASDVLCRAVTGEGNSKRQLYTDDDDIIFSYKRCIILNGINVPSEQSDLLERTILLELDRIPEEKRQEEGKLIRDFEKALPDILGGIFDALVKVLQIRPKIKLKRCPRMADFTLWGCAIAEALGYGQDKFLEAYFESVQKNNERVISQNPVATVLLRFMENKSSWEGTASDLFKKLKKVAWNANITEKELPKAANALTRKMNNIRPDLMRFGITYTEGKSNIGEKLLSIEYAPNIKLTENTAHIAQTDKSIAMSDDTLFDTSNDTSKIPNITPSIEQDTAQHYLAQAEASVDMSDMSDKIRPLSSEHNKDDLATPEYVAEVFGGTISTKSDDGLVRDEYGTVQGGYPGFEED